MNRGVAFWRPGWGYAPLIRGYRLIGCSRGRALYVQPWLAPFAQLWFWWFYQNGRWTMERDLIDRGLMHGPEGGFYRDYRVCPVWPMLNIPKRIRSAEY